MPRIGEAPPLFTQISGPDAFATHTSDAREGLATARIPAMVPTPALVQPVRNSCARLGFILLPFLYNPDVVFNGGCAVPTNRRLVLAKETWVCCAARI